MAVKHWTILDVDKDEYLATQPGATEVLTVPGLDRLSIGKSTKRGGLSDGVDVLHVINGDFSFRILPTRGMGIWDMFLHGERIGWNSPVRGPVHPKFVDLGEPSGLGWLDGFNELLVRCGLESNGAPEFDADGRLEYPLHGRIANRPAHRVAASIDGDKGEVTVVGVVEEARFLFTRFRLTSTLTTKAGESVIQIRDEVENLSGRPAEMQLLYHVNFGEPLLDAGSRFIAPVKTVVPRNDRATAGIKDWDAYAAAETGFEEQVYLLELLDDEGQTTVMLKNAIGTRAVSLQFNIHELRCFTLWKNTGAPADGCVTGLEPGTNFPNPRTFEGQQGRVVKLAAGEKFTVNLRLEVCDSLEAVAASERSITKLQGEHEPRVFDKPQTGWCAGVT